MRLLAHQVLRRVALWSTLAVVGATGLGYAYAWQYSHDRALEQLRRHAELQGLQEEQAFRDAIAHLEVFRAEFLRRYQDRAVDYGARFDAMYQVGEDGAVRLDRSYFRGHRHDDGRYAIHTTGFLGRRAAPPDEDLRRRAVITTDLVAELGPAWREPFANLHASLPDNGLVIHWPGVPWGLQAAPDLDVTEGEVIAGTRPDKNPSREAVWSGLYFDKTARQWTVTVQLPVDHDGRHLVNPSHDILLDDILARLGRSRLVGAQTLLLGPGGHLIAGPDTLSEGDEERGILHVNDLDDPFPARVHRLANEHFQQGHSAHVMQDEESGAYVVFTRVRGPDWRLATIYPSEQVAGAAHRGAAMMLALGLALQLILLVVVGTVLGRRVSEPVRRLRDAADRFARGEPIEATVTNLPLDEENEIGSLSRSFHELARQVEQRQVELEGTVEDRTRELATANRRLEQLTRTDSLTALPNRRAFDDDLAQLLAHPEPLSGLALGMLDVDYFKPYNDTLGHEAGDQALRKVADVLAGQVRRDVRCYRYGGEEFALVFTAIAVPHAERILRRILEDIVGAAIEHPASPLGVVTVSAGLAKSYDPDVDAASLVRAADRQLYAAKASGRNRVASD
ncbi:GGDEF domain-containing protein [Arenimonas soli]|uniref:diguanylate cyclase n=1 Tax=Arenimonas soli TaxID=2269504 RepID=A0ABQ1HM36_9GAMM|nr:GGDEF domain-containing protein [Arenimonas soli]GGA81672.1 GGDEF domain-containing protein [Arenimonas soli]